MRPYKILITLSLLFGLLFSLSACGPMYNTSYAFQQPKSAGGKQCVNRCLENRSSCKMQCNMQNEQCRANARQAALPAYVLYVSNNKGEHHDKQKHRDRTKTIDDFADYSNCSSNCDCDNTYNQCFANCGGVITENRQCVAFCDKVPPNQLVQSHKIYQ